MLFALDDKRKIKISESTGRLSSSINPSIDATVSSKSRRYMGVMVELLFERVANQLLEGVGFFFVLAGAEAFPLQ